MSCGALSVTTRACGCDPLEHDEDSDGIPDRCDNCPALADNPQGAVQDMDGVGDVCDPQLEKFSPRVRFMAFDALPTDLVLTPSGPWKIEKDALLVGPTAATADYIATYDANSANVVVRTRANLIVAGPPVVGAHSFGLWAEADLHAPQTVFPTGTVFELVDDGSHFAHLVEVQQPNPPPLRSRRTCSSSRRRGSRRTSWMGRWACASTETSACRLTTSKCSRRRREESYSLPPMPCLPLICSRTFEYSTSHAWEPSSRFLIRSRTS